MLSKAPKKLQMHPKAKATKILGALIDVFQRVWLRCRHLALMLQYFIDGSIVRMPDFGSYRVEVVVLLFCRIVDVQNFDLVWERLQPQEIACIYCRLGILHFFNPLKLEGCYSLDISRYEERVVAKMLAVLSTVEPGENWINETFRWEYFAECIPGWELTKSWLKDENMPHRGYLFLEYYSGGCTKFGIPLLKAGCNPVLNFRKSLLALVYITEDCIIDDDCNRDARGSKVHKRILRVAKGNAKKVKSESAGAGYIKDYLDHWNSLLATNQSTSAKIARGEPVDKVFAKLNYSTTNVVRDLPSRSNVFFGAGDVVIDKSSEKGKKMMERMQERVLKRARDAKDQESSSLLVTESHNKSSAVQEPTGEGDRKKRLDLSVDTAKVVVAKSISLLEEPSRSLKKKHAKPSTLEKILLKANKSDDNTTLTSETPLPGTTKKKKLPPTQADLKKEQDRLRSDANREKRKAARRMNSSMATVQSNDREALVLKLKKSGQHIERGK